MSIRCPQCQSTNVSGLMEAFWVELDDTGDVVGEWSDYESCTEVGDGRMCRDCGHEWKD